MAKPEVFVFIVFLLSSVCLGRRIKLYSTSSRASSSSWKAVLGRTESAALFEKAMADTFSSVDQSKTLGELRVMLRWLKQAKEGVSDRVPELRTVAVQQMANAAIRLATMKYDQARSMEDLEEISTRIAQLSSKHGCPMTRRLVVGAILKLREANQAPFSEPMQLLVDKVLLQLFRLHHQSSAHKGAIQFFHISKSGGTNLCMAAEGNGCASESFDERRNCLVREFSDEPRWAAFSGHKYVQYSMHESTSTPWFVNYASTRRVDLDCAARAAYLQQNNWNFYANEYTVAGGERGICKQFVNLIMFRDPLARLTSQISWIQKLYKDLYNASDISQAFKGRTSGFWDRLAPAAVNNYYIRSLLGTQFFDWPVASVNITHTQQAMLEVMQHDLLMMLEHKEFNDIVLKVGLGWENSIQNDKIRSSSDMKDEISMPMDYEKLIARNSPDVKVHRLAEQLQVLDVLLFKFVLLADRQTQALGLDGKGKLPCGYVSSGAHDCNELPTQADPSV